MVMVEFWITVLGFWLVDREGVQRFGGERFVRVKNTGGDEIFLLVSREGG